jgi:5-methyltetrahydropteroyltriglutamate--homocysteine methyltransferase
MSLLTTTIGSYPKPDYVPVADWFRTRDMRLPDAASTSGPDDSGTPAELEALLVRGTHEVVGDQVQAGIDVPTDGEVRRENYIHYHCRHLGGVDFDTRTEKTMRSGAWTDFVPTVSGPIKARDSFLPRDYRVAQAATDRPVKITAPGPLTLADTLADAYYGDERRLGAALADAINLELHALAEAGCTWIQVDEPVFAREPAKALAFGFDNLARCFHGLPGHVTRVVHMCCGYPARLDQEDYLKADRQAYFDLAGAIDQVGIQFLSIEDAHQHNDLSLLEQFHHCGIILGVVAIARTRVEPVEEIATRLAEALEHIEASRLLAAPDCGLGMLDRATARAKMANLAAAAHALN